MDVQVLIVVLIVVGALVYAGAGVVKKVNAFRPKAGCGDDCGCGSTSKKAVR